MSRMAKFACGSALNIVFAATAFAAPADQGGASANTAQAGNIETITVTAQRREELARDVPFSITTLSSKQIEQAGVVNMMDLTRVVPGLVITGDGAWSMPSMRGVSTTVSGPGNDSPIAIYVDGVYQPNELGGFFDLPDIKNIEVDKGPQGTLFGRNATGGAIQIWTKAPSFTPGMDVSATAGFFAGAGSSRAAADTQLKGFFTGPLSDNLAASLSFHVTNTDGYLDDVVRHHSFGDISDSGARLKLLYNLSDSASFTLTAYYNFRDDDHAASAVALHGISIGTLWPGGIVASRPWQISDDQLPYDRTQAKGIALRGDIETGLGTITSTTSYADVSVNADVDTDLAYSESCLSAAACVDFKLPNYWEHTFSQEVYLASNKIGNFSYVVGANAYLSSGFQPGVINDFSQVSPFPSLQGTGPIFAFSAKIRTTAFAAFTELNYDLTDRLHLIGGLRYSDENKKGWGGYLCCSTANLPQFADKTWSNVIGRASIRYDLDDESNVYFTFSQGFKSGVVPYSDFSGLTAKPENINSFEIGYKGGGENWQLNLAGFYYDYSDMQVQTFDRIVSQITNAASSTIAGIDLDGTYQATDELQFHLGATWLPRANFDTYNGAIGYTFPLTPGGLTQSVISMNGKRLLKTPELTSSLTATYQKDYSFGNLRGSVSLYYSSSFNNDIAGIIKDGAYATLATELTYRPTGSNFELSVWGHNLTNTAYVNSAVPGAPATYVVFGPPLEIGVTVGYGL